MVSLCRCEVCLVFRVVDLSDGDEGGRVVSKSVLPPYVKGLILTLQSRESRSLQIILTNKAI